MLELGLDTFGDRSTGADGALVSHAQRVFQRFSTLDALSTVARSGEQ